MNKVILDLTQVDGNAFAILGAFKRAAQQQGWPKEEIDKVVKKAMESDYNHLLVTILDNTTTPENTDDEDFDDYDDDFDDDEDVDDENFDEDREER